MKRIEEEKLSQCLCYSCRKKGHLAVICPNMKKEKPQVNSSKKPSDPQVEQDVNPQVDDKNGKKKTRRDGRRTRSKRDLSHIKCFECEEIGHFASSCPNKLVKKAQASKERQASMKQDLSKKKKAQHEVICFKYRRPGHLAKDCPRVTLLSLF